MDWGSFGRVGTNWPLLRRGLDVFGPVFLRGPRLMPSSMRTCSMMGFMPLFQVERNWTRLLCRRYGCGGVVKGVATTFCTGLPTGACSDRYMLRFRRGLREPHRSRAWDLERVTR